MIIVKIALIADSSAFLLFMTPLIAYLSASLPLSLPLIKDLDASLKSDAECGLHSPTGG